MKKLKLAEIEALSHATEKKHGEAFALGAEFIHTLASLALAQHEALKPYTTDCGCAAGCRRCERAREVTAMVEEECKHTF
jgi:hypothetical protein